MLTLTPLKIRAYAANFWGGSLFRMSVGAVPFLLPLMFQLIFGMSPFQSGMLTFVSAIGAFTMKFLATTTLRAAGFRTVTVATAIGGGLMIGANALFTVDTPSAVIVATLLASGFLRSLFFTSTNAMVFAEVADNEASQATAIAAACQQISVALGVACAGGLLEMVGALSGNGLDHFAFIVAFVVASATAVLSAALFFTLPADVGQSMSGHSGRGRRRGDGPAEMQE